MLLAATCDLAFEIEFPTPFVLMLRPRSGYQQWISSERYKIDPRVDAIEFTDMYGNLCQRIVAPPGPFSIHTSTEASVAAAVDIGTGAPFIEIQHLPDSVLVYLLPSRYCESESFLQMAREITDGYTLGYDQVAAIERWLVESIRYEPGGSDNPISAIEVNKRGAGVCRDLAHLGIALCRSISIPARLGVGFRYQLEPMDMHAWFEAFVGNRWYTFDAVQSDTKGGYVAVGYGRDAADVALFNQFGPVAYPLQQNISVTLLDDLA